MQFLKTLFWVILAVVLVLFAHANWEIVTINLWGGLQADVKLPLLVGLAFLIGFLPVFIVYRARIWSLRRRIDNQVQAHVVSHPAPARVTPAANTPSDGTSGREATDSKAWPAG
jgi:putative membrane protein